MTDPDDRVATRRGRFVVPRVVRRVLVGVLLVLVAVAVYQVARTGLALHAARSDTSRLSAELSAGDRAAATRTARDLTRHARVAHDSSSGWVWGTLAAVPVLGDNADAVRRLAAALDGASAAVPDALDLYAELDGGGLRSGDGRIDLATVASLRPGLERISRRLDAAERVVAPIRPEQLLPGVRGPVAGATDEVRGIASALRAGVTATELLPTMMGSTGPRRYLLVAQNNAETRATGGLPGALATLVVRDGRITLGPQRTYYDFRKITTPLQPVSADERALFGLTPSYDLRDTLIVPDFPTAASRIRALVQRDYREQVDGVLTIDPVTLAEVLRATGPVTGPDGREVGGDDAVKALLNDPYKRFADNDQQDAYFAAMTKAIFDRLLSAKVTPALLTTLSQAVDQRRVLVWSAHPDEQARLTGSAIAGAVPTGPSRSPQVGLYLNDAVGAKLEYYLRYDAAMASLGCDGGRQHLRAAMTLTSRVPADTSSLTLSEYGPFDVAPRGWIKLVLRIYGPTGGSITSVTANGAKQPLERFEHLGRPVDTVTMVLRPGGQIRLQVDLRGAKGATADPRLQWTPSITWGPTSQTPPSSCD